MRTPQLEDGFTRWANPLLDALIKFPPVPTWLRVFLYVGRMTYGFQRKTVQLRFKTIAKATGIRTDNIHKAVSWAKRLRVINTVRADGKSGLTFSINKQITHWQNTVRRDAPSDETKKTVRRDGAFISLKERKKRTIVPMVDPYLPNPRKPRAEWAYRLRVDMPAGFHLTDKMRTYATTKDIDPSRHEAVFEHFCSHHSARGTKFKDWGQAWRVWCQNDLKWKDKPEDAFDGIRRRIEEDRPPPDPGEVP